jgi:hypothetical protein
MPKNLKLLVSAIVVLAGAVAFYFEARAGAGTVQWIIAGLVALMILAMWVFPEAGGDKNGES